MANIDAIIKAASKKAAIRRLADSSRMLPTPAFPREVSNTERNAEYHPSQYGILFCVHGKSRFDKCSQCKRTDKIAKLEYLAFCKRNGLAT